VVSLLWVVSSNDTAGTVFRTVWWCLKSAFTSRSVEDSVPTVAHAPKRGVFALFGIPFCLSISGRSHECERGTQECVRYKALQSANGTDSLMVGKPG
jgi:hypothetical protein